MNLSGLALGPETSRSSRNFKKKLINKLFYRKQIYLDLRSVQKLPEVKFKKIYWFIENKLICTCARSKNFQKLNFKKY